ncbi:MAG: heavy metal-associated domain-containing protein [Flavobacteriaceae bacterium]|nr:heavy metal-associated domain-containing protein [Flavobacteriaceae bacterium]
MKSLFYVILFCFPVLTFAQKEPTKTDKALIEVLGNCKMCKSRIEKAAIGVKGVKYASWDIQSGQLQLIYNGLKTNVDSIEKQIAAVGHDTEHHAAIEKVYDQLPACCQYVREGQDPKPGQIMKH